MSDWDADKMRVCAVDGCGRRSIARRLCNRHYLSARKAGTLPPKVGQRRTDVNSVFRRLREGRGGCWIWTGATSSSGYGLVKVGGRQTSVHRLVYEELVIGIPDGLVLDHLCRNRACANPEHLEPVTQRVNVLRGVSAAAAAARATHCGNGHEYNERNTRVTGNRRECRVCDRERRMKRKESAA